MATHSSVLAWRIPGTGEPGGLPSVGSHRVGHDWSDLAAAAVADIWLGFSGGSDGKESACSAGELGLITGLGRSPGEGDGNPLQHSCLENPIDSGVGRLQSLGSQRVGHNWELKHTHTHTQISGHTWSWLPASQRLPHGEEGHSQWILWVLFFSLVGLAYSVAPRRPLVEKICFIFCSLNGLFGCPGLLS